MITNEQILQLAEKHLEGGGVRDDGSCSEYYGTVQQITDFAQAIYSIGNECSWCGWKDRAEGEYLNSSYPT
jgi:hypothetical protein